LTHVSGMTAILHRGERIACTADASRLASPNR